ncbi:MAG: anti-sigma factor antagonist [Hydrococcus sp. C42_A2020_068]|uniref:anti-sigma factor antagonist n=1 Tax=Pleurocapsa sp. PCC 7327 TaxID=118163 RepID=UPI00029FDB57|nr:anti-sigma factor antagonist [Pleurocapsa sp. PCC 7327]AFY77053.1 anti-anti-sigma factor [Pleurocapsa sp. PCC 7327]MBF2022397.1 anti-sigma factor antagonist [Hydrococcus sp. C42_A2020_068]
MTIHTPETDFSVVYYNNLPVIQMPQRLTILEAVAFKEACHQLLDNNPTSQQMIFDFKNTEFIDSSGVGALVHNSKATGERGIELILYNVRPPVMAVLSMTGLDRILQITSPIQDDERPHHLNVSAQIPETHPSVRSWVKRLIDIVGSLVGLGITAIAFIPIAIAIQLDDPGPIFFFQTRCGWLGKQFKIIKFRSMCVGAEALKNQIPNQAQGAIFKNQNDPRVTKVGRFLRRTSLDELPQFWNVLVGDMSLVGTRPPTPDEVERYEVPEWQRLDVKPGMTGEWQVNGRSQITNFEDVIKLDLRYQKNWSLKYDLELILKTILILFRKNSGAF